MSHRMVAPVALMAFLSAALIGCGGNPFLDDPGSDGGDADSAPGSVYANDISDDLAMNSLVYDPLTDELVINNIPFDGATAANGEAVYANVGGLPGSSFSRYENVAGALQYYAVFRRSATGAVQAGATATPRYIEFGIGGLTAQRNTASVTLPASGEFTFLGEYAAVRVFNSDPGTIAGAQYVTGDVELNVDFGDFDTVGAVVGLVTNRQLFDQTGAPLGPMDDFVSLATSEIDRATGIVAEGQSTGQSVVEGTALTTGSWQAVLGGPAGSEVAGIVVLEGFASDPDPAGAPIGSVRESGVFIAIR